MPLSFSFSTQRHSFDSETAVRTGGAAVLEVVMQQPPGVVITEPLQGFTDQAFVPPPAIDPQASAGRERDFPVPAFLPPAPSPNQRPVLAADAPRLPVVRLADSMPPPAPAPVAQAPSTPLLQALPQAEWAVQIEQLRNDIFGIAMSVSALNDRLDRLDQRVPQAGAGLAALRSEIGTWLENHLSTAVEHCMHRLASRAPSAPATGPLPSS